MKKPKKQGATTFEGGEGATAAVTVERKKVERKPDPHWVEKQKRLKKKNPKDKRKRHATEDISWEGYKK